MGVQYKMIFYINYFRNLIRKDFARDSKAHVISVTSEFAEGAISFNIFEFQFECEFA